MVLFLSYYMNFKSKNFLYTGVFFTSIGFSTSSLFCFDQSFKNRFPGSHLFLPFFVITSLPPTVIAGFDYYSNAGLIDDYDRKFGLYLRFYIGLMLTSAITMYWIVSKYGVVLNNVIQVEQRVEQREKEEEKVLLESDSSDEEDPEPSYNGLECGICSRGYSSNLKKRVPRMLRCGHTVCYGCAKRHRGHSAIRCPFCQIYTFEDSKNLPKNYTVIGLLEEMKVSGRRCSCAIK
uniref:RING-type domain-containing protein n=1 Tax=Caenorhabditis tropicalis TaxID=1561998 RepID=A0A1I7V2M8_9PELO